MAVITIASSYSPQINTSTHMETYTNSNAEQHILMISSASNACRVLLMYLAPAATAADRLILLQPRIDRSLEKLRSRKFSIQSAAHSMLKSAASQCSECCQSWNPKCLCSFSSFSPAEAKPSNSASDATVGTETASAPCPRAQAANSPDAMLAAVAPCLSVSTCFTACTTAPTCQMMTVH